MLVRQTGIVNQQGREGRNEKIVRPRGKVSQTSVDFGDHWSKVSHLNLLERLSFRGLRNARRVRATLFVLRH